MLKAIKRLLCICLLTMSLITVTSFKAHADTYTYTSQDVTAYTASWSSTLASGVKPNYNYVAVHPKYWGQGSNPIFPFGAYIQPNVPIYYQPLGTSMNIFQVQDIGDKYYSRGLTKYFLMCIGVIVQIINLLLILESKQEVILLVGKIKGVKNNPFYFRFRIYL